MPNLVRVAKSSPGFINLQETTPCPVKFIYIYTGIIIIIIIIIIYIYIYTIREIHVSVMCSKNVRVRTYKAIPNVIVVSRPDLLPKPMRAGGYLVSIIIKNEYYAILHHSYAILRHEQKVAQLKMMALYIQACNY